MVVEMVVEKRDVEIFMASETLGIYKGPIWGMRRRGLSHLNRTFLA